jgi:hypothetical protein
MTNDYAEEIIKMKNYDLHVRARLADSGELFKGYNQEMEEVHIKNARYLENIMQQIGWPGKDKVGTEARDAAMIIVQHAISLPDFQKRCLQKIKDAIDSGQEEKRNYAFLYDRICFNERRPQKFGTQYDWDENGQLSPWTIENPNKVNTFRLEYGLNTIDEESEAVRKGAQENNEQAPCDFESRQQEIYEWSRRIGWIK